MRRAIAALVATGALTLGVTAGSATAAPSQNACHGQTVAGLVQAFGGARNAAQAFGFSGPHAVQQGQQAVRDFCAGP